MLAVVLLACLLGLVSITIATGGDSYFGFLRVGGSSGGLIQIGRSSSGRLVVSSYHGPISLAVTDQTVTTIDLGWSKDPDYTSTMVRRKTTPFTGNATNVTEGTLVYEGTDNTCTDSDLACGTTYYFRAWSYTE